jgi:hypothetical protein
MTFLDQVAADVTALAGSTGELSVSAQFHPLGRDPSFACTVCWGDETDAQQVRAAGMATVRSVQALGILSALRAGIAAIEGAERDPTEGDQLVVTAPSSCAGRWRVVAATPDAGGGCILGITEQRHLGGTRVGGR